MRIEIPECGRCCICIPLRYGILIFGYLNLAFSTFQLSFEIWLTVAYESDSTLVETLQSANIYMYKGVDMYTQMWFLFVLYTLEIVFNVLLLIGAHLKKPVLLRAYYYYGITTSLAALVSFLVVRNGHSDSLPGLEFRVFELCVVFSGLVLQAYLLLLIRSELKKLELKTQMCFVNHAAEVFVDSAYGGEGRNPL